MVDHQNQNHSGKSTDNQAAQTLKNSVVPEMPDYPAQPAYQQPAQTLPHMSEVPATYDDDYSDSRQIHHATPPPPPPLARDSAARSRARQRQIRRRKGGDWAWVVVSLTLLTVVLAIGISGLLLLQSSQAHEEVLPTAANDLSSLPTSVNYRTEGDALVNGDAIMLDNGYSFILEPWDGESRFTLLAMGLDRRPGETGLAYRTDTMILASIDPVNNKIGILSIPRDLYVVVPGYSVRQRVNTPLALGEGRSPGSGPYLSMQTVQYNLGIRVHEYLIVDFNAVIGFVDAIGGIDITTEYTINDTQYPDMNFGYDPFYLPAGSHHLDGYNALRFARTRHGDNDIERAGRQQQVIYAVRDKILNLDMLPQLMIQSPTLLNTFQDNIYTSMSLDQMLRLALYVRDIPNENITTGVINYDYMRNWETSTGAQVLIPNQTRLGDLMVQIFGANYSE